MTIMDQQEADKGTCRVCHGVAAGIYFGAQVCLPCKSFYIRCTKDGVKLRCQQEASACTVNNGRFKCQACRFKACRDAGMQRKEEKPEVIEAPDGTSLCQVCGDIANGVHFGVTSCEGCKKFFRRGLTEWQNYQCKEGANCAVNPRTRNQCRYCRYQACLKAGMSREAIKVGRPPNKKENSRHHPYGINLSLNHYDSPALYQNGYMKTEAAWDDTPSLSALPALIHSGGAPGGTVTYGQRPSLMARDNDLNSSCTSQDINNLLMNYMDVNGEAVQLPSNYDLEETFAQINSVEPSVMSGRQFRPSSTTNAKFTRIENLPHRPINPGMQFQNQAKTGTAKPGYYLEPIKVENTGMYRDPGHTYSHPSPPYDPNYDPGYLARHQEQAASLQNNPFAPKSSTASGGSFIRSGLMSHASSIYPNNIHNPISQPSNWDQKVQYQQQQVFESQARPAHQQPAMQFKQSPVSQGYGMPLTSQAFTNLAQQPTALQSTVTPPGGFDSLRRSPGRSPAAADIYQPQSSPYGVADSPYSNANTNSSGYATDSQDFLEEFSIYDPVDIQQVNHKYMPSCSQEPLVFNEQALTVEDLWSGKTEGVKDAESDDRNPVISESRDSSTGNGMFKHMKSIDDKVDQSYWFRHDFPDGLENTDEYKEEMEYLMRGWLKSKDYINATVKNEGGKLKDQEIMVYTHKPAEEGKDVLVYNSPNSSDYQAEYLDTGFTSWDPAPNSLDSYWPNVKENAPLQLKMWDFIQTKLLRGTTAQVMFYQHIRGSSRVLEADQKTLVSTSSFTNVLLMNILYWWDEEKEQCKYFWSWKVPPSDPFYVFRQTLLKFSQAIRDLNFDEKEIMLLCALMLFSSDILRIKDKETINKEREPLVELCAVYCREKYKDDHKKRLRDMLSMAPALRYLSIWHHDLMAFAKTFGSTGLSLDKMKISES